MNLVFHLRRGGVRILRLAQGAAALLAVWLMPLIALAQEPTVEAEPAKSYVLGYALTSLCIGLGIFVVVRPGKRKPPKIRRKSDDDEAPRGH